MAVARAARELIADARPILICSGTGFNGGDGLAAARHLHAWGSTPRVVLMGPRAQLRDEPAVYADILERLGCALMDWTDREGSSMASEAMNECGVIIDALLGIGARGPVRAPMAALIDQMNRSGKPIVAVDLPSGSDGDTGAVQGMAVRATVTVALGLAKHGCVRGEGPAHVGALRVDPIMFPPHVLASS